MYTITRLFFLTTFCLFTALISKAQEEYTTFSNLAYLSEEKIEVDSLQRLNLVVPTNVENPPLLIWIGAGAWSFVNRHQEMDLAKKIAEQGIAVASVGHRLSKGAFAIKTRTHGVKHPAHIQDVAAAVKWLVGEAKTYGYDADNIFVGGYSSGAHLAALLATDQRYLKAEGLDASLIKGILPVGGTYDIVDYHSAFVNAKTARNREMADTHVKDVFGETEKDFKQASPVTYLKNLTAPMLLISDRSLYRYTEVFEKALQEIDYQAYAIYHVFQKNHNELWEEMSYEEISMARMLMVQFILQHTS